MLPRLFDAQAWWVPTNYGILVAIGFLVGLWVITRLSSRSALDRSTVMDIAVWGLVCGILGAKLTLVLLQLDDYLRDPARLLDTLRYAGVFYGGFAGGMLFLGLYAWMKKIPLLEITDLFAPGLAVAHGFGRIGCFLAGCCWGGRCTLPWAVTFTDPHAHEAVGTPLGIPLHPVQLYEALLNFALFGFLLLLWKNRPGRGWITAAYVGIYAVGRFLLELLRADPRGSFGPFSTSQWFSLAAVLAVAGFALWRRLSPPDPAEG